MDIKRRKLLTGMLSGAVFAPFVTVSPTTAAGILNTSNQDNDVFSFGIASGDPSDSGVIIWTRINPEYIQNPQTDDLHLVFWPLNQKENSKAIKINADEIKRENDFTVRINLDGMMDENQFYHYQFEYGQRSSIIGRCRTLPASTTTLEQLKLAVLTCQDFTTGYYNAFSHLADEAVDFVVHMGDFIYEYSQYEGFEDSTLPGRKLTFPSGQKLATTLEDFRHAYKTYRSDKQLQKAMAQHTWILSTDDHDCADNCYWNYEEDTLGLPSHDSRHQLDAQALMDIKLSSQKAWFEYVPTRVDINEDASHPHDYLTIYRNFKFGQLAEIFMTDSRTYRSEPSCDSKDLNDGSQCMDIPDPKRTMLGDRQRNWLIDGINTSDSHWKIWGNQTLVAKFGLTGILREYQINKDAWDGFPEERKTIARAIKDNGTNNFVTLTGDLHTSIVTYSKIEYTNDGIFYPNGDLDNLVVQNL
ncbi:alkaline phosphatase D family protein [Veronia pacifica]|nr:alkaline phosphatase D family protein [Veronia pacifica]